MVHKEVINTSLTSKIPNSQCPKPAEHWLLGCPTRILVIDLYMTDLLLSKQFSLQSIFLLFLCSPLARS